MTCIGECVPKCRDRDQYVCGSMKCYVLEDTCNSLREEKDELANQLRDTQLISATYLSLLLMVMKNE